MKKDYTGSGPGPVIGIKSLSALIARRTGLSNTDTKKVLRALIEIVGEVVRDGSFVVIKGLFSARIRRRQARNTYVPSRTGAGRYTVTPERSYMYMRPCIPIIKGIPLRWGKTATYIKKEN